MSDDASRSGLFVRSIASAGSAAAERMSTEELRSSFLIDELFAPGELRLVFTETDRYIVGGVVPVAPITLRELPQRPGESFLAHRELGVLNLGGPGTVRVGDRQFALENGDCLYVGQGEPEITFASGQKESAVFYLVSCPAHARYATTLSRQSEATVIRLGHAHNASARSIRQYIHPGGVQSCQLMMGITQLEPGSVWNTMPAHTHDRRSEIYLYNRLAEENFVVHLMGRADSTRSLIVRNREAVLSPSWSMHAGAGTSNYQFIWAMAGENQDFDDFAPLPLCALF